MSCPEQANGAPSKGDLLAPSPQQETGRHAVIPPWAQLIRRGIHFDLELNCGGLIDIGKFFETSIFETWGLCPLFLSLS